MFSMSKNKQQKKTHPVYLFQRQYNTMWRDISENY